MAHQLFMNPEDLKYKPEVAQPASRAHYWKFVTGFLMIVVAVFAALWGLARYERLTGEQQIKKLADAMKQIDKEDYAAAVADTAGGKTPKETLQMYISALEKRDFALATQYFAGDAATKEAMSLKDIPVPRLLQIIDDLKKTMNEDAQCDPTGAECSFHYPISVDLRQYPNGIWKLSGI